MFPVIRRCRGTQINRDVVGDVRSERFGSVHGIPLWDCGVVPRKPALNAVSPAHQLQSTG
jgi:hypothetical protein